MAGNRNLPILSAEERAANLKKAGEARTKRAEVKRALKAGEIKAADVLNGDDEVIGRMKAEQFIRALPGYGKVRAAKAMEEIGIGENRHLSGLGKHQRAALIALAEKDNL